VAHGFGADLIAMPVDDVMPSLRKIVLASTKWGGETFMN